MSYTRVLSNYLGAMLSVDKKNKITSPKVVEHRAGEFIEFITVTFDKFEIDSYYKKLKQIFREANTNELRRENYSIIIDNKLLRLKLQHDVKKAVSLIAKEYFDKESFKKLSLTFSDDTSFIIGLMTYEQEAALLVKLNNIGLYNRPFVASMNLHQWLTPLSVNALSSTPLPSPLSLGTPNFSFNKISGYSPSIGSSTIPTSLFTDNSSDNFLSATHSDDKSEPQLTPKSQAREIEHSANSNDSSTDIPHAPPLDNLPIQFAMFTPILNLEPQLKLIPQSGLTMSTIHLDNENTDFHSLLHFINRPSCKLLSKYLSSCVVYDVDATFALPEGVWADGTDSSAEITFEFKTPAEKQIALTNLNAILPLPVQITEPDKNVLSVSITMIQELMEVDIKQFIDYRLKKFPTENISWHLFQDVIFIENISFANRTLLLNDFRQHGLSDQMTQTGQSLPKWMHNEEEPLASDIIAPQNRAGFCSATIYLGSPATDIQKMIRYLIKKTKSAERHAAAAKAEAEFNDFQTSWPATTLTPPHN